MSKGPKHAAPRSTNVRNNNGPVKEITKRSAKFVKNYRRMSLNSFFIYHYRSISKSFHFLPNLKPKSPNLGLICWTQQKLRLEKREIVQNVFESYNRQGDEVIFGMEVNLELGLNLQMQISFQGDEASTCKSKVKQGSDSRARPHIANPD